MQRSRGKGEPNEIQKINMATDNHHICMVGTGIERRVRHSFSFFVRLLFGSSCLLFGLKEKWMRQAARIV